MKCKTQNVINKRACLKNAYADLAINAVIKLMKYRTFIIIMSEFLKILCAC